MRERMRSGARVAGLAATAAAGWVLAGAPGLAQQSALPVLGNQARHARGQNVVPLYRGWYTGADGRIRAAFEYLNRNAAETLDIPIGPDNRFTPAPADRGQPTHFLAGHQHGVFAAPLPAGSTEEIAWTLRVRGQSLTIPSNLGPLYEIEGTVTHGGSFPGNTPPVVRFAAGGVFGQGPDGLAGALVATAGVPVALSIRAEDDGLPAAADRAKVFRSLQRSYRRRDASEEGVSVVWSRYRGVGTVDFADAAPPVVEGVAATTATFGQPGEYVLRALVSDGSGFDGCCWTNAFLTVTVTAK